MPLTDDQIADRIKQYELMSNSENPEIAKAGAYLYKRYRAIQYRRELVSQKCDQQNTHVGEADKT